MTQIPTTDPMPTPPPPRIPMLSIEAAEKAARSVGIPEYLAPLSVFRILLQHPRLAGEIASTLKLLLSEGNTLDERLRELVIMRIGWKTNSVYEWTQHWRVARMLEIPEQALLATRDWQKAEGLSDVDRAVLAATDETLEDGMISDETWGSCCTHLKSEEERIELVLAIGNWCLFSQLLKSLKVPLEEGVEAWQPDGISPNGQ